MAGHRTSWPRPPAASTGERVLSVAGDLAHPDTPRRLADAARRRWGGVDVLINSAGVFEPKPFLDTTPEDLDRALDINLRGTYRVTQAIVPLMIAAGGGSIVNVGAALVSHGSGDTPASAAMASKGGLHALTVAWAAELARHSIRVNTLSPGIIRIHLIGAAADALASWAPLGRTGEVSDTSEALAYLAAASFATGSVLTLDGGYSSGR